MLANLCCFVSKCQNVFCGVLWCFVLRVFCGVLRVFFAFCECFASVLRYFHKTHETHKKTLETTKKLTIHNTLVVYCVLRAFSKSQKSRLYCTKHISQNICKTPQNTAKHSHNKIFGKTVTKHVLRNFVAKHSKTHVNRSKTSQNAHNMSQHSKNVTKRSQYVTTQPQYTQYVYCTRILCFLSVCLLSPVWVAPLVWVAPSVCRAPSVWAPSVWVGPLWAPPLLCLILST